MNSSSQSLFYYVKKSLYDNISLSFIAFLFIWFCYKSYMYCVLFCAFYIFGISYNASCNNFRVSFCVSISYLVYYRGRHTCVYCCIWHVYVYCCVCYESVYCRTCGVFYLSCICVSISSGSIFSYYYTRS